MKLDDLIAQLMQFGPQFNVSFMMNGHLPVPEFELKLNSSFDIKRGECLEIEIIPK